MFMTQAPWVYTFLQTHQFVCIKKYNFLCVNHTLIKWYRKKKEKIPMGWPVLNNFKNTVIKYCHSHLQG